MNEATQKIIINALIFLGIAVGVFALLNAVGIVDNPFDVMKSKKLQKKLKEIQSGEWLKKIKKEAGVDKIDELVLLSPDQLDSLAYDVYDSYRFVNDDEEQLYSAFQSVDSLAALSALCIVFHNKYKKDLFDYIESFTSVSERAKIWKIVKGLKLYGDKNTLGKFKENQSRVKEKRAKLKGKSPREIRAAHKK